MRNKQWQKHRKKDQTTANQMTVYVCFFNEVGTAVWPREFYHGNFLLCFKSKFSKANSRGKIPVVIPRFLLRKKKTPSIDSPWFGLSYGAFAIVYSSLVTSLWLIHRDSRNLRELTRRRLCKIQRDKSDSRIRWPKSSDDSADDRSIKSKNSIGL